MNSKIFKKIISLFVILTTTHVYADNLPDSLFGVKMFDSINNYEVAYNHEGISEDGTHKWDYYELKNVPNPNGAFSYYTAITNPNDDKIISLGGTIEYVEESTLITALKENLNAEPSCAARDLPKYVTAVSNAWQISESKFSDPEILYYGKEIPENLEKGFDFYLMRKLNFKKNNINMIATVSCSYFYYAFGDSTDGGATKTLDPFISSDLWINVGTEEYFKRFPALTKVYKDITVGNFIRQLPEGF